MGLLGSVRSDAHHERNKLEMHDQDYASTTIYGSRFAATSIPKYEMPEDEMPGDTAYQLIKDELDLDGTPSLNLASFVTTYMDPQAEKLMAEQMSKNFIDYEEYPSTVDLHNRCVNMIARLFHAPMDKPESEALGVSTIGSSEAIILATLAMKKKWKLARQAAGKSTENPNLVMSSAVQVCWEKATRYLEIEEKFVNCTHDRFVIDPQTAVDLVDENTIGVVGIIGTTYTGEYEDIKELARLLDKKQQDTGLDVKIHVDAASGGFVAPFVNPELVWDFQIPRVVSINASGHKYGLTFAGVGWAIWRSKEYLDESLVFHVAYLGADQASFTLNFSKSAMQVLGQYYNLIRYGKSGYKAIMTSITNTADFLAESLVKTGRYKILSKGEGEGLPVVAFKLAEAKHYDEYAIAAELRQRNWIVPAYTMAPDATDLRLLRIVCRADFSRSKCERLIRDLEDTCVHLDSLSKETIDGKVNHQKQQRKQRHHHHASAKHDEGKESKTANVIC